MITTALSIRQPWAHLIVTGQKDVENRTWSTKFRGPFAIHASKTFDREGYDWVRYNFPEIEMPLVGGYRTGGVVGVATITKCVDEWDEVASPWFFGPMGFVLADAREIDFIQCPGKLGFFTLPFEIGGAA